MIRRRSWRWRAAAINLGAVVLLLLAAGFLPPDTSLADRQKSGLLKLCVPQSFPPLVTGDPSAPGYDVELAGAIAAQMGLRLQINTLPSIGRDFNPRNWSLTRAQCDLIGGGVADSVQTRSFLQTIPTGGRTGWIGISPSGAMPEAGSAVAVLPGTSGLNRVELSTWLRSQQLRAQLVRTPTELAAALESGAVAAAVTERFLVAGLDLNQANFQLFWLEAPGLAPVPMALGLWKGDQTLKRSVDEAMSVLASSGTIEALRVRYGVDADLRNTNVLESGRAL
jgi:ABC-type amino acid transport substrate-binding protein